MSTFSSKHWWRSWFLNSAYAEDLWSNLNTSNISSTNSAISLMYHHLWISCKPVHILYGIFNSDGFRLGKMNQIRSSFPWRSVRGKLNQFSYKSKWPSCIWLLMFRWWGMRYSRWEISDVEIAQHKLPWTEAPQKTAWSVLGTCVSQNETNMHDSLIVFKTNNQNSSKFSNSHVCYILDTFQQLSGILKYNDHETDDYILHMIMHILHHKHDLPNYIPISILFKWFMKCCRYVHTCCIKKFSPNIV